MFRPLRQTHARWRPLDGEGLKRLTISQIETSSGATICAGSTVIGGRGGEPYGIRYRIDCLPDWSVLCAPTCTSMKTGLSSTTPDFFQRVTLSNAVANNIEFTSSTC
jgi:hypothetical protein